jgi:hypothetical protein
MGFYRKKPVVVEAIQWTGNNYEEIQNFSDGKVNYYEWFQHNESGVNKNMLSIFTLEGKMEASIGDFIIKGVQGEFYPCKPDIFEKTYEEVWD